MQERPTLKPCYTLTIKASIYQQLDDNDRQQAPNSKKANIHQSQEQVNLLINYNRPSKHLCEDFVLAEIYLLFQNETLFIKLKESTLNDEINWDNKTLLKMESQFANTRNNRINIQYYLNDNILRCYMSMQQPHLSYSSTSEIKVLLFQKDPINLYISPYQYMRELFTKLQEDKQQMYQHYLFQQSSILQSINSITSTYNSICNAHHDQILAIKEKFMLQVNLTKEEIRKRFGKILYLDAEDNVSMTGSVANKHCILGNGRKIIQIGDETQKKEEQIEGINKAESFENLFSQ